MKKLAVITAGHKPYHGALMERSAREVGIEVIRFATEKPWPGDYLQAKVLDALECIRTLRDEYTHVLALDCSDSLFLGGADEILGNFSGGILIQAEKNCYPHPGLRNVYPERAETATAWNYINSGGWIGERDQLTQALPIIAQLCTFCDQYAWNLAYLAQRYSGSGLLWTLATERCPELGGKTLPEWTSGKIHTRPELLDQQLTKRLPSIKRDLDCSVFQSLYLQQEDDFAFRNGRLHNRVTKSTPSVLHWNGTRGKGAPYSRTGIWYTRNLSPLEEIQENAA